MPPAAKKPDEEDKSKTEDAPPADESTDAADESKSEPFFEDRAPDSMAPGDSAWEDRPDPGPEVGVAPEVNQDEADEQAAAAEEDPAIAPAGYIPGEGIGQSPSPPPSQGGAKPAPGVKG